MFVVLDGEVDDVKGLFQGVLRGVCDLQACVHATGLLLSFLSLTLARSPGFDPALLVISLLCLWTLLARSRARILSLACLRQAFISPKDPVLPAAGTLSQTFPNFREVRMPCFVACMREGPYLLHGR